MTKAQRAAARALAERSWRHSSFIPGPRRRRGQQPLPFTAEQRPQSEQDRINREGLAQEFAMLGLARKKDKSN